MEESGQTSYITGSNGNTLKQYVATEQSVFGQSKMKKPEVKFRYQNFELQSGFNFNESMSHFNFSQYQRDYSVKDAES